MRASHHRFPLHEVRPSFAAPPATLSDLLDSLFGTDSGPDVIATRGVPSEPLEDDIKVGDLPKTRAAAQALTELPEPIAPVNKTPIQLPFEPGQRPNWRGIRRWGKPLRTADLDANDRRDLRSLLRKELASGALEHVTHADQVRLLTPVFVVRRNGKLRLVHDLRPLNTRLRPATVRYCNVRDTLTRKHNVATRLDLASAFKHLELDEEASSLMAFQIDNIIFRWRRLPFGLSWSPTFFANALQSTIEKLRKAGVILVVYVDDVYVGAQTVQELDDAVVNVMKALADDGWRVAPDKVYPFACSSLQFLGLTVHINKQTLSVPTAKAQKLAELVKQARAGTRVPLHLLQRITGLLAFFIQALPQVGLAWRGLLGAQTEAERLPGRHVWRRGRLDAELAFWEATAADLPRFRQRQRSPDDPTVGVCLTTDASDTGTGAVWWMAGEVAPDLDKWAADPTTRPADHVRLAAFHLDAEETSEASATRELIGLDNWIAEFARCKHLGRSGSTGKLATSTEPQTPPETPDEMISPLLQSHLHESSHNFSSASAPPLPPIFQHEVPAQTPSSPCPCLRCRTGAPPGTTLTVSWTSDSTCAVAALEKWRSGSSAVTNILARIFATSLQHRITIQPSWVSRELQWLPAADYLSRVAGRWQQAEYSVPEHLFSAACDRLRIAPDLDLYASASSRRLPRFRSQHPEPGSEGPALLDPATWHAPSGVYAFPPFSQLTRLLQVFRAQPHTERMLLLAPRSHPAIAGAGDLIVGRMDWPEDARLLTHDGTPAPHPPPRDLAFLLLRQRQFSKR